MNGRLPPALWEARGRRFGSGRWRSAPGPGQEPLPGRTEPRAGPSAKPVIETGNGPASPWGSTDPAPGKTWQRLRLQHTSFWRTSIINMLEYLSQDVWDTKLHGCPQAKKLTCMSTCLSDWLTLWITNFLSQLTNRTLFSNRTGPQNNDWLPHQQVIWYFVHFQDRVFKVQQLRNLVPSPHL